MSQFHIRLQQVAILPKPVVRWCLDFPKSDQPADAVQLAEHGLLLQGWCISQDPTVQLYLKDGESLQVVALNRARPDVVSYFSHKQPKLRVNEYCGFRLQFVPLSDQFEVGVYQDDVLLPLVNGKIAGPFNIIQGEQGWLYLDNDTNKSVDQFRGQHLLSEADLVSWHHYILQMRAISEQKGIAVTTLIAPAKEMIYPQFYPHQKGQQTPVEQLLQLDPQNTVLIYPDDVLRGGSQATFRKVDTHWTPFGAMLATTAACSRLGLSTDVIKQAFASDKYHHRTAYGDLGNKVYPRVAAAELMLRSFRYHKHVVYDNGLQNFGRVIVIHNKKALLDKHLLLLGSSSSYTMFDYICRLYQTVTFIHTAGNFALALVEQLQPDYLLTQTNARFIVRPPATNYVLEQVIQQKWLQLSAEKRAAAISQARRMASDCDVPSVTLLHQMLEAVSA